MEKVHFCEYAEIAAIANHLFNEQKKIIKKLLPKADIQHVGSTAVPDSLTKRDLDIQVRVTQEIFPIAVTILSKSYKLNEESDRTENFCAFISDSESFSIGIQLTVQDSEFDFFWKIRDFLLSHPQIKDEYNLLKKEYQGKAMSSYRQAKALFFNRLMNSTEFKSFSP